MNYTDFVKGLISNIINYQALQKVPAEEFNEILNKLIVQGNNNAEGVAAVCKALVNIVAEQLVDYSVTPDKIADNAVFTKHLNEEVFSKFITQDQYLGLSTMLAEEKYSTLTADTTYNRNNIKLVKKIFAEITSQDLLGFTVTSPDISNFAFTHYPVTFNGDYLGTAFVIQEGHYGQSAVHTLELNIEVPYPAKLFTDFTLYLSVGNPTFATPNNTEKVLPACECTATVITSTGRTVLLKTFTTAQYTDSFHEYTIPFDVFEPQSGESVEKIVITMVLPSETYLYSGYNYTVKTKVLCEPSEAGSYNYVTENFILSPAGYKFYTGVNANAAPKNVYITANGQTILMELYQTDTTNKIYYYQGSSDTAVTSGTLIIEPDTSLTEILGYWVIG